MREVENNSVEFCPIHIQDSVRLFRVQLGGVDSVEDLDRVVGQLARRISNYCLAILLGQLFLSIVN